MEQVEKKRDKFLSGWLIFLLIANPLILLFTYGFLFSSILPRIVWITGDYIILIVLNTIFSFAAWQWKKWGIWGLGVMTILASLTSVLSFYFMYIAIIEIVGVVILIIFIRK